MRKKKRVSSLAATDETYNGRMTIYEAGWTAPR